MFPSMFKHDGTRVKHLLVMREKATKSFVVYVQDKSEDWKECDSYEIEAVDFENYLRLLKVSESFIDLVVSRAWDDKYLEVWVKDDGTPEFNAVPQEDFYNTIGEECPWYYMGAGSAKPLDVFKPVEGTTGKWWTKHY